LGPLTSNQLIGDELLRFLSKKWEDYKTIVFVLTRLWTASSQWGNKTSFTQLAFNLFRDKVFEANKDKLTETFQNLVSHWRNEHRIEEKVLREMLQCYTCMGMDARSIEKVESSKGFSGLKINGSINHK